MRKSVGLALLLATTLAVGSGPGRAQAITPLGTKSSETREHRATIQGGLVDIRYGQVSIDRGGTSTVLELGPNTFLSLDGVAITAEELVKQIPRGLSVVAGYDAPTGFAASVDAFSDTSELPGLASRILPWRGPAYGTGELVTVVVSAPEVKRLGGPISATIPGIGRDLAFVPAQEGGRKVMFRVLPGMDFSNLPIFVTSRGKVHRAGRLNVSTTAPTIVDFGPRQGSAKLASIPGWVDLRARTPLLDPTTARLTASPGARVVSFQPRVDRSVFEIEADGPGEYWLDFSIEDKMGRTVRQRWPVRVLP